MQLALNNVKNDEKCLSCCAGTKMSANHDEKELFCVIMCLLYHDFCLFIY